MPPGKSASKRKSPVKTRKNARKGRKKGSRKYSRGLRIVLGVFLSGLFLAMIGGIFVAAVYYGAFGKIPDYRQLREIRHYEASSVFSEEGELLGKFFVENRTLVPFQRIPRHAVDALIATEDVRFFEHHGVDRVSMLRVLFKSILLGDKRAGGGSTISQQLAKNLYPRGRRNPLYMPVSKVKEIVTAHRLEQLYEKTEILTLYLNTVSFGEDVFGIESAAQKYFSTTATGLSLPQAATLIGMLKGPSLYNPRVHPERSLERRNTVIAQMVKYDYLPEAEGEALKKMPLGLRYSALNHYSGLAPYLREQVRQEAHRILERYEAETGKKVDLYRDGLVIRTTLNAEMQRYAEQAVAQHMGRLQKSFNDHWQGREPWEEEPEVLRQAIRRSEVYRRWLQAGKPDAEILEEMKKPAPRLLYDPVSGGEVLRTLSAIDSIKHCLRLLHPGVIAVVPQTGRIKAWVGGLNYKHFQYDQVLAARQVGSVFKPVVYSAALQRGASLSNYYADERRSYPAWDNWSPRNSDGQYGGYYTLRGALSRSVNTIAVEVLLQTGIPAVIGHARSLGITGGLPEVPSLALGVADLPLEEMIRPYLCFANRGKRVEPYFLQEIRNREGDIIYRVPGASPKQVIPAGEADLLSLMLTDVIDSGTGRRLRTTYGIDCPLAGKTGTTQNQTDGWFIGYNPEIVIGVRVGANDPAVRFRTTALGQGANTALPIFGLLMQQALSSKTYRHWHTLGFATPAGYTSEELNAPSYLEQVRRRDQAEETPHRKAKEEESGGTRRRKGLIKSIGNWFKKKN